MSAEFAWVQVVFGIAALKIYEMSLPPPPLGVREPTIMGKFEQR